MNIENFRIAGFTDREIPKKSETKHPKSEISPVTIPPPHTSF